MQSNSFARAIAAENDCGFVAVIPDIKCVSPKEGDLLQGRDPVEVATLLVASGACLLSVVTEREHFGGSVGLLRDIACNVDVPVLRKDFITDEAMLLESLDFGASAVLLICSILDEDKLSLLYRQALVLGLEPFVEVHNEMELEWARQLGAPLIGINNRNIETLELDEGGPARTAALAPHVPEGSLLVSESGILSPRDACIAARAKAHGILVGTALWQAPDMATAFRSFRVPRKQPSCVPS